MIMMLRMLMLMMIITSLVMITDDTDNGIKIIMATCAAT
jgi:hypothetical protein